MKLFKVGDVLPDGREILAVDDSLKRYDDQGNVTATGVEYKYVNQNEGEEALVRKFQNWS